MLNQVNDATQCQVLKQTELLGQQLTVYGSSSEPLFKAKDVATWIKHSDVSMMVKSIDEDEKGIRIVCTPGGNQKVMMLTEDGLYEVLMQSRKPIAKEFKKGVKAILKEIRTTGGYMVAKPEESDADIMAKALLIAQRALERKEEMLKAAQFTIDDQTRQIEAKGEEIKALAPKAQYTDEVLQSSTTYTLTQAAKDLGMRSVHSLTSLLKEKGVIYYQSDQYLPTAKFADKGYFKTRTARFFRSNGEIGTSPSLVVTEKGRAWLHHCLGMKVQS